jgi:signal transduction histidine kinase/CheY-like chemotaxis protein
VLAAGPVAAAPPRSPGEIWGGLDTRGGEAAIGRLQVVGDTVAVPVTIPLAAGGQRAGHLIEWRRVVLELSLTNSRLLLGNRDGSLWTDGKGIVAAPPPDPRRAGLVGYRRGGASYTAILFEVAGTPWVGLVEAPAAAVQAPVRRFLGRMAAVAAVLFIASVALAWFWSLRVTRPLVELARAADLIAEGDLTPRVAAGSRDELGRLESAFNRMAERLAESQAQLERQVHELQHTREQFTRAQRMEVVGLLAGGVAHDFNNVLTIVLGEAELALADLEEGSPVRQSLLEIAAAGERGAALTRQLLVFSRGQLVEPAVFDLHEVVEDSERMLRRLLRSNIQIQVSPSSEPLPVRADRGQVEQVVMNLVVNARDAMPAGGHIYLETQRVVLDEAAAMLHSRLPPGDYAALVVSDTGTGMSEEVKARLFEPFFSTKQPGKGTGLGLPACRGIVERWGGHIAIYSEGGVGTSVKAYLPFAGDALVPAPAAPVRGGSEAVLVVDDEPAVRELASRILASHGYRVLEAGDATSALRVLAGTEVALLITDVVLPGSSGRELADRATALRPGLGVLFMSGYTEDVILQRRLLAHHVVVLRKPFTAELLARRAREVLDAALV